MRNINYIFAAAVSVYGIANADSSCSSSNAITVESLSASASGPGGVSNSVIIALGNGLTKAGIQNLKRGRDDNGGGKGGGNGGNGGGGHGGNGGGDNGGPSLDCSNTSSGLETCYSVQSVPFCYNYATNSFHAQKISGNASNGNYTLLTGQTGNLYSGPYPTPTGTITSARATATGDNHGNGGGSDDTRTTRTAKVTSTDDNHGNGGGGGGGSDDTKTPRTTATANPGLRGNSTAIITEASTIVSGVATVSDVLTTTLAGTASTNSAATAVSSSVTSSTQAGGAGHLASPNFGFLGAFLGLLLF